MSQVGIRTAAVAAAALLMCWPAVYNRYPLLYPDSMSYLQDGPRVARAVFLGQLSPYYGGRSFVYAMGIVPFHWNVTPWPILGLHAVLTAYVLWLMHDIGKQHHKVDSEPSSSSSSSS